MSRVRSTSITNCAVCTLRLPWQSISLSHTQEILIYPSVHPKKLWLYHQFEANTENGGTSPFLNSKTPQSSHTHVVEVWLIYGGAKRIQTWPRLYHFFNWLKKAAHKAAWLLAKRLCRIFMRNHQRSLFSPTLSSLKPQPFSKQSLTPEGFAPASWSSYFKLKKGLIMIRPFENFSIQTLSMDLFLHLRGSGSIHPRWVQMRSETFHWRLSWIGLDCGQRC